MAKRRAEAPCAVCKSVLLSAKLSRVVVEGRTLLLCRAHAAVVAANMPQRYEDLRRLFPEDGDSPNRRSVLERRGADDRRVFPPRPEGRRMPRGRRAGDVAA